MNATAVGHETREGFASEAVTTVAQPSAPSSSSPSSEPTLPLIPHGACVNCGLDVTLRVVATEDAQRIYQWVPSSEPARPGRWCSEASMPAYHWAADATAAVYKIST